MAKNVKSLGVMIDASRNAVMSLDGMRRFFPLLKKMGYNTVFLYTEDTYEVDGEPYFGYMRGRYSKAEMKELDEYASSLGIEVIPCIQTLAHLNGTLRWNQIPVDCDDIMLTDNERNYQLIDHMFATLSECFKTRRIHVGMDEALMLGRGKHLDLHGYESSSVIIKRHLEKVCEIAKKYDYEVMLWSDMFFRSWCNGAYYINEVKQPPKEVREAVAKNVIPVYWDYYHQNEKDYDIMIENHKLLTKNKLWFAGGVWTWSGFAPHNAFSISMMSAAMRSCKKNGVKNIFMTMWGDDGSECSKFSVLPALFYVAELAKGNEDMELIKAKFKRMTGISFDEFMMLDAPNNLTQKLMDDKGWEAGIKHPLNPCKYMLYSDYFNDFLDYSVVPGASETYKEYAVKLAGIAKKSRKFGYLFNTLAKLCEALSVKYELGLKTRRAYEAGDKETLRALAENDYVKAEKLIRAFGLAFEKQWFADNKPCGFDVQDHRIGGILQRTVACRRRILDYVNGKIDSIQELEEKLLPFGGKAQGEPLNVNRAKEYLSTNVTSH